MKTTNLGTTTVVAVAVCIAFQLLGAVIAAIAGVHAWTAPATFSWDRIDVWVLVCSAALIALAGFFFAGWLAVRGEVTAAAGPYRALAVWSISLTVLGVAVGMPAALWMAHSAKDAAIALSAATGTEIFLGEIKRLHPKLVTQLNLAKGSIVTELDYRTPELGQLSQKVPKGLGRQAQELETDAERAQPKSPLFGSFQMLKNAIRFGLVGIAAFFLATLGATLGGARLSARS